MVISPQNQPQAIPGNRADSGHLVTSSLQVMDILEMQPQAVLEVTPRLRKASALRDHGNLQALRNPPVGTYAPSFAMQ
jgi:hypothetical protein